MEFSLNEIAATTRKAVRGAGYPWGIADEAAANQYWMASYRLNGCPRLVQVLQQLNGVDHKDYSPDCQDLHWRSSGKYLCPLITSCALTDRVKMLSENSTLTIANVAEPLLLIKSVFYLASFTASVSMRWSDCLLVTDGKVIKGSGSFRNYLIPGSGSANKSLNGKCEKTKTRSASDLFEVADVTLCMFDVSDTATNAKPSLSDVELTLNERSTRAHVDFTDWQALDKFANRTYAPATEESRLKGAGSNLSDND